MTFSSVPVAERTFRTACRDYAAQQVDRQREDFQRLGVLGDWQRPYLTMDFHTEANIVRALGRMIEAGHLLKGSKPVYWCLDCASALAEAEVEYEEKTSPAIDVMFPVINEGDFWRKFGADRKQGAGRMAMVIWTTTPWTLPANQAVALHPDFDYQVIQCETSGGKLCLLLATELTEATMQRCGIKHYATLSRCKGQALAGLKLQHPFYARAVPIILGEHVTLETGTGAVHIAPGHGLEDYVMGSKYGLPIDNPVGGNGCFLPGTELFAGENVFKANDHVIEVLQGKQNLLHGTTVQHSYPHCWRHKTPVIFRATPQWFISMDNNHLRADALRAIDTVRWIPDWGRQRIRGMVADRPDWCISRQRTWGVPIAVFVGKKTGELHPRTLELVERVAKLIEHSGIDAWFDLDARELLGAESADYDKVVDTLDVWFDSGVTHAAVLDVDKRLHAPADLYLEGSDQHRGWFQSSLLTSAGMKNQAPYLAVLTHGFTVDAKGMKMSKSKGNVVAPQQVMKTLGADILRLWVSATDYRNEMAVSDEILKRMADAYRRLRNTARYLLSNLADFNPARDIIPYDRMLALDQWAVQKTAVLQDEIIDAYDNYQFHLIYQKLHNFCVVEMSGFYLDITKDRQYTTRADSLPRRSAQTAVYHIIEALVRWFAPVLSFTADEIWKFIPGQRGASVFLEDWYKDLPGAKMKDKYAIHWARIIMIRDEVSKVLERLRVAGAIGSALDAELDIYCRTGDAQVLNQVQDELRFVLITSYARVHEISAAPGGAEATGVEGVWIKARPSSHQKCVRCWHHREDVGKDDRHPELCLRCVTNVDGPGEERRYA